MVESMRRRTGWLAGRQAGFSMIETLFVIIILGIVTAFAMPAVEGNVARSKADRVAATISNDLRNAFSLAARQRKPVRILIDAANRTLTIRDRASGTVFVQRALGSANTATSVTSMAVSSNTIDILPNGIASDTLAIRFAVATHGRVVKMTRVGQIRMQ